MRSASTTRRSCALLQAHPDQGIEARLEDAVRRREDARHDAASRHRRRQDGRSRRRARARRSRRARARELAEERPQGSPGLRRRPRRPLSSPKTSSISRPARSSPKPATSSTPKLLAELKEQKVKEFPILDIDHVNVGAFIRNTLNIDKNANQRGSADGHLPGHAPGRAADDRSRDEPVPRPVLRSRALRSLGRRPREDEHAP